MYTLTKEHRQSLLHSLEEQQQSKESHQSMINNQSLKDGKEWFEAKEFLNNKMIELIKQSLIANEIDY